jgi:hypothetical protein
LQSALAGLTSNENGFKQTPQPDGFSLPPSF